MPGFPAHAEALSKGLAFRSGMDLSSSQLKTEPDLVKTGKEIAGLGGYACITCHAAGETPALQAFEGQGPNLQIASDRLRPDYYRTWMFWPQRHAPLTIMPKYTVDKERALNASFYEGSADKQFEAIRHYLQTLEGAERAPSPAKE
jgi:mono/diheme cytochrome c family protein